MKTLGALITAVALLLVPAPAGAQERPILVVDKCPEFCPPNDKPKWRMCAQVLIPVKGKKDWFWTDSCKTKMMYIKSGKSYKR